MAVSEEFFRGNLPEFAMESTRPLFATVLPLIIMVLFGRLYRTSSPLHRFRISAKIQNSWECSSTPNCKYYFHFFQTLYVRAQYSPRGIPTMFARQFGLYCVQFADFVGVQVRQDSCESLLMRPTCVKVYSTLQVVSQSHIQSFSRSTAFV